MNETARTNNLNDLMHGLQRRHLAAEISDYSLTEMVFAEHRDRLITAYCAIIRLHAEIDRRNLIFRDQFPHPAGRMDEDRDWCNAGVHILTIAAESTQRFFLVSDLNMKRKLINAVLDDGGIWHDGTFLELPPV